MEQQHLFPENITDDIPQLASISRWLRKEREFAFYGDVDFIPTEEYRKEDADRAIADVLLVLRRARSLVSNGKDPG